MTDTNKETTSAWLDEAPATPPAVEQETPNTQVQPTPPTQEVVVDLDEMQVLDSAPPVGETKSKQNVEFKTSPYMVANEKTKTLANPVSMVFPSDTRYQINETINETSNTDFSASAEGRKWASVLMDSMSICPADDVSLNAMERSGSTWRQSVPHSGGELEGTYARFREKPGSHVISGDSAVIRLQQHLRLGSSYRVPLWNSGFWVTFRAPDEPALMELERSLTNDKIDLGRQSYGLTYSNTTAIFNDRVVNFAMEHIWNTSVKVPQGFDLREIMSNHDISALLMGLAAAIWPDGFNHSRVCIANPDKCQNTIEELISIPKTLMVDTAALTSWQIAHMSKVSNSIMTLEEISRYKQEMVIAQERQIVLCKDTHKEITLNMRIPNVNEFITAGNVWINQMVQMVDTALGKEVSNEKRNQYIINHGKATNLRQYGQWIYSIKMGESIVEDRETLDKLIGVLSGDDDTRVEFMQAISDYIAASTVTVVGVPSFVCPKCKGVNRSTKGHPTITEAIPYDPLQVFFGLLAQRVQRISER